MLVTKPLPNILAFTRASKAWDVDASGALTEFAVDAIRRGYDPATLQSIGWNLEGGATNLLLGSAAPSSQSVTVAAVLHTLSFYGTGAVALSGASTAGPLTGTGANSLAQLSFTPAAGALNLTVSGDVRNAQLEANYAATSRIVTVGAQVARAAETLACAGSAFAAIFGAAKEGWVIADVVVPVIANLARVFSVSDGTANNAIEVYTSAAGALIAPIVVGGTSPGGPSVAAGTISPNVATRVGLRWGGAGVAVSGNGGALATLAAAIPPMTGLYLGNRASLDRPLNGRIRSVWAGANGGVSDAAFRAACTLGADPDAILRG